MANLFVALRCFTLHQGCTKLAVAGYDFLEEDDNEDFRSGEEAEDPHHVHHARQTDPVTSFSQDNNHPATATPNAPYASAGTAGRDEVWFSATAAHLAPLNTVVQFPYFSL